MATKRQILKSIDEKVRGIYSVWQIGVTQNLLLQRTFWEQRDDIFNWSDWEADNMREAIEIERYFSDEMGMKGSGDFNGMRPDKPTYVYVF